MYLQPSYRAASSPWNSLSQSYSSLLFLLGLCQQWELLDAIPQGSGEPVSSQSGYHGLHIQRDAPPPSLLSLSLKCLYLKEKHFSPSAVMFKFQG